MLEKMKSFVVENKGALVKIGGAVIGGVIGVVATALILSSSEEPLNIDPEEIQ